MAKSAGNPNDRVAIRRARRRGPDIPMGARHEALSVALARSDASVLACASDRELVLHLIGTHHGRARPFWPVVVDREVQAVTLPFDGLTLSASPQHRLEHLESCWIEQFWAVTQRYGPWGMALLEAILMLADHTCSRREQREQEETP